MPGTEPTQTPLPAEKPEATVGSAQPGLGVDPLPPAPAPEPDSTLAAVPVREAPGVMPTTQAAAEAGEIAERDPITPAAPEAPLAATPPPGQKEVDTAAPIDPPAEGQFSPPESHVLKTNSEEKTATKGFWESIGQKIVGIFGAKERDFQKAAKREEVLRDPDKIPVQPRESDTERQIRLAKIVAEAKTKEVSGVAYSAERYTLNTGETPVVPAASAESDELASK